MDSYKVAAREQQIRIRRLRVLRSFPVLWSRMIGEWRQTNPKDQARLMYSASYLLRIYNVHWAIDPLRLKQRLPEAGDVDLPQDLDKLSFVRLTHCHSDHMDFELIRALRHLPIR